MDIIMNYVAFAGITEIDNLYGNAVRFMKSRELIQDSISNEESEIRDELLKYPRE